MNFRTRLRFHSLPMPDTAADVLNSGGGGGGDPPATPWYATDPEWAEASKDADLKGWVEKANPKSPIALLKSQRELEGKLGGSVAPWKEGEDPTKWPGWEKLGVPKDAAGYKISRLQMPEGLTWDEGAEKAAIDLAVKMRAPPHLVQAFVEHQAQQRIADHTKLAELTKKEKEALDGVYTEWGVPKGADGKFTTANHPKVIDAQRALKAFGVEGDVVEALEGFVGGGKMMKLLSAIGAHPAIKEGKLVTGEQNNSTSKDQALAKISELDAKYQKEGLTKEEKAQRSQMFALAYPNGQ